jgi:RNA polymerase sigma-70 factor (ECF subfamily)
MRQKECRPSPRATGRRDEVELLFERLFVEEFERCVRVARRIVGNEAVAQDIAAEAFTRAWRRWPSLHRQRPGAWVVKVSTNLAIDATRRRPLTLVAASAATSHEDSVVQRSMLVDALSGLTPQQQAVLRLRYVADLTLEQIALALDVSVGTVKTHVHRALKRLRQALEASAVG